jgi:hypothetical protein
MQAELGGQAVILGVDAIDQVSYQGLVADVSDLPWLQDVETVGAWELWDAEWRDVWVLDPDNRLVGIYNLSAYDLAVEDNYRALEDLIRSASP